jgi:hypothetical protein
MFTLHKCVKISCTISKVYVYGSLPSKWGHMWTDHLIPGLIFL